MEPKTGPKKRSLLVKAGRITAIVFLSIILLVFILILLIQTAPVQNFARKKVVAYLNNKLQTKVEIGHLDIEFPKKLVLENVYIEDRSKDTLLAGKQLKVDLDMFKLIKSDIQINEINLNGITAKIKRQLPDTVFNFQFIVDAFVPANQPTTTPKDTSAMKIALDKIIVDKTRFVYNDVVTGNDVDIYLNHFDTRIKTFDPDNLIYNLPKIAINGLRGSIKQTKPLTITAVKTAPTPEQPTTAPKFLKFLNDETTLTDAAFFYTNAMSGLTTDLSVKELTVNPKDIDLEKTNIVIDKLQLDQLNGYMKVGEASADVVKITNEKKQEIAMPWKLQVNNIELDNNNFKFDDVSKPRMLRGMDYAHLGFKDLTLHADNFMFDANNISGVITDGSFKEKSGFVLNTLETKFDYTPKGATLTDLLIETPGTRLQRSASVRYPSLDALQKNMGLMQLDVDIANSKVQVKDILTFAPQLAVQPAFRNPNATLYLDSRVRGSLSNLHIDNLNAHGIGNTKIDLSGSIYGLPNANNVTADLSIRNISTTRSDIYSFVPANTIPSNIALPEALSLSGVLKGGMNKTFADLSLRTTLGSVKVNGSIANPTNKNTASYNANIVTSGLNLGAIMKNPQLGKLTANLHASGTGFDPKVARATIKGRVNSADFNQYVYRNLDLNATIANQHYNATADIKDPNIDMSLVANGSLAGTYPTINVKANIDSIKTLPLHFTPDAMIYRGNIVANFSNLNPDALTGNMFVTNSLLVRNGQRIQLDTVSVLAEHNNNQQFLSIKSDFLNATLDGQYKLTQLGNIIQSTIQPYFAIASANTVFKTDPYNFAVNVSITDHPTLRAFLPDLKRLEPITLVGNLSNVGGMKATLNAPAITYGTNNINGVVLNAQTEASALKITTTLQGYTNGPNLALYNTSVDATMANNQLNFALLVKDKASKDKYRLNGTLAQQTPSTYVFSLAPQDLLLNYQTWTAAPGNMIRYNGKDIYATNFNLSQANQMLSVNSVGSGANSPLQVSLSNFKIATVTAFVQTDSLLVDGTINGNVMLKNLMTLPSFTTDLVVNDLSLKRDTIGDVNIKVNNTTQNVFATDVRITGRGNDVSLTGNYYLKPANNSNLDFDLNIRQLPFKTIEAFSMGAIDQSSGNLTGKVAINGSATAPKIDGNVTFNKTAFNVVMLGSPFMVDGETVKINNDGIRFDTFTIKDSASNTLVVDGMAYTNNFTNYRFNLSVNAKNFRGLNKARQPNDLYYGQLYFNSNVTIKGTETSPIVDGNIRINDKTNLTVIIPQQEPGVVDRKGVIDFVDMDAPGNDSLFKSVLARYDSSFNKSAITGFDITANIEVVKDAEFNVVIDESNGDFLKLKGEALLNAGIDPSGKITMTGSYELESGAYELSFNFIRRRFEIQKGSRIVWTGEPTTANVDVTAIYVANTNSLDLVGNQVTNPNIYLQKLPFQVKLMINGQLMQPILTFDIALPTEDNARVSNEVLTTVNTRLDQLKSEPSELNKQVFALLLLNRFVAENPFESSGGGFNAGVYARQSVSKILTEQLNRLAGDLIAGVDIAFDVNSTEDYTTGEMRNRTDFNVALSKRLLNDRLKVTVGNDFELEGPQRTNQNASGVVGNISVDYQLTPDGRYLIRGYRKNEYEAVVEGFVIETGLKFIMSVDYNRFRQVFQRRRKKTPKDTATTATSYIAEPLMIDSSIIKYQTPEAKKDTITYIDKVPADDRKNIPATVKVSPDGY